MSFGSGHCGICDKRIRWDCDKRIRWDDEFCSDLCEAEAERRSDPDAGPCIVCGDWTEDTRCARCKRNLEEDRMNRELGQ